MKKKIIGVITFMIIMFPCASINAVGDPSPDLFIEIYGGNYMFFLFERKNATGSHLEDHFLLRIVNTNKNKINTCIVSGISQRRHHRPPERRPALPQGHQPLDRLRHHPDKNLPESVSPHIHQISNHLR